MSDLTPEEQSEILSRFVEIQFRTCAAGQTTAQESEPEFLPEPEADISPEILATLAAETAPATTPAPEAQPETTLDFVKTRCRICAAGQTIVRHGGVSATYCLLLREWMSDKNGNPRISACDRYELKDTATT